MLDERFDPEFYRTLASGQVSASDLPRVDDVAAFEQVTPRLWLPVAGLIAMICLLALP